MRYIAEIDVMPLKELLDPQGKTVNKNLLMMDLHGIEDGRIGKHIKIWIDAENEILAKDIVEVACKKLLCNPIMENYVFTIIPA